MNTISCLLFLMEVVVVAVLTIFAQACCIHLDQYSLVRNNFGGRLCAVTSPNETITNCRSLISCSGQCSLNVHCGQFNFWSTTKACHLFFEGNSVQYLPVEGCSHYLSLNKYEDTATSIERNAGLSTMAASTILPLTSTVKKTLTTLITSTTNSVKSSTTQKPVSCVGNSAAAVIANISIPRFNTTSVLTVDDSIVIQQRFDKTTAFNRPWIDYRNGFGNFQGNYWMGLEKVFQLTNTGSYMVTFELCFPNGTQLVAQYSTFYIESESQNYAIHVTGYSGTAGDIMNTVTSGWAPNLNGMQFSTPDRGSSRSCASGEGGGWWYNNCDWFNINGDTSFCVCKPSTCSSCQALSSSRMLMTSV